MQRRQHNRRVARRAKWRNGLVTAAAVVGVASAGVWLVRDVTYLVEDFGPAEGSLIVNINTATQAELESVPGIGPTRAAQIIVGRPYGSVNELGKIAGVGGKTLESLRPFVTIEGKTRAR